ncbi:MAG TPA: DUF1559 domain-containing protein [Lacipirellulaceae bacterium]
MAAPRRLTAGLSLLELIVVLFIISVMIGLLLPAVHATRAKARATACQNNVRQLGLALIRCVDTLKKFPDERRWTTDILKWMEEWPLADEVANGIPQNAELPRPRLYRCPAQADVPSTVANVAVCHYVLTVDRKAPRAKEDQVPWELHDRERLSDDERYEPWYVGPEITFTEQREMFATKTGPHSAGELYTSTGQVYGLD